MGGPPPRATTRTQNRRPPSPAPTSARISASTCPTASFPSAHSNPRRVHPPYPTLPSCPSALAVPHVFFPICPLCLFSFLHTERVGRAARHVILLMFRPAPLPRLRCFRFCRDCLPHPLATGSCRLARRNRIMTSNHRTRRETIVKRRSCSSTARAGPKATHAAPGPTTSAWANHVSLGIAWSDDLLNWDWPAKPAPLK